MFATGNYHIKEIAHFLAESGVKTESGKTYQSDWVTHIILSNPFYYGYFRYQGEVHQGIHKPIITKKLFDQCQSELAKRSFKWRKTKERVPKPFVGLFRCGECGMMITAEQKTKFYPQTDRHATYTYYRCTKKSKTHPNCHQPFIREENLDGQLTDLIQKVSLPADWKEPMLKLWEKDKTESFQSAQVFVQAKRQQILTINQKLKFLTDSYLDQTLDRDDYLEQKNSLVSKRKSLEEEIGRLEQKQNDWLGPFREWILEAAEAAQIATGKDLNAKKVLALKIYGSNLVLQNRLAWGDAVSAWAALRAAPTTRNWERGRRIELPSLPWEGSILPVY